MPKVEDRMPFFSVIIPTYNRKELLKIAVESILRQTYQDFELIIVDDGSTDNTKNVAEEYLESQSHTLTGTSKVTKSHVKSIYTNRYTLNAIRYIYQPNQGPAAARNRGIKEAKGKFICFLDSDDRFLRQKLEVTYKYIKKYPQYKIFHTEEIWYRNGRILSQKAYHKKPDGYVFNNSLKICSISISTAAIKNEIFDRVGSFDENMPVCEDYDFWLKVSSLYPVKLIPVPLTIKEGGHPNQQSKKFTAIDRFRIHAINKILASKMLNDGQKKQALEELNRKCGIYIKGAKKRGKENEVKYYSNLIKIWKENDRRTETTIRN